MQKDFISKEKALEIAQDEVTHAGLWPQGAKVKDAFPIYMDGIESVSYYECKVVNQDKDAGYVLVNANKTDIIIPESTTEGVTVTEMYRKKLNRDDFLVIRYDWLRNVAVELTDAVPKATPGEILSSIGFDSNDGEQEGKVDAPTSSADMDVIGELQDILQENRVFPIYDEQILDDYYNEEEPAVEEEEETDASYRDIMDVLNHTFHRSGRWHTPAWRQIRKPNRQAIGCGNAAWAIVYGYWRQHKRKTNLFNGDNVDTTNSGQDSIAQCMRDCAAYTETRDVINNQGFTWPRKMCQGIQYAKEKGYRISSCRRIRGNEFSKFDQVFSWIQADKPAIFLISSKGRMAADHYVVIEGACKRQKRNRRKWRNRDVRYLVNWGHGIGTPPKWIYVREFGRNTHRVYSGFSIFLVDIR